MTKVHFGNSNSYIHFLKTAITEVLVATSHATRLGVKQAMVSICIHRDIAVFQG